MCECVCACERERAQALGSQGFQGMALVPARGPGSALAAHPVKQAAGAYGFGLGLAPPIGATNWRYGRCQCRTSTTCTARCAPCAATRRPSLCIPCEPLGRRQMLCSCSGTLLCAPAGGLHTRPVRAMPSGGTLPPSTHAMPPSVPLGAPGCSADARACFCWPWQEQRWLHSLWHDASSGVAAEQPHCRPRCWGRQPAAGV